MDVADSNSLLTPLSVSYQTAQVATQTMDLNVTAATEDALIGFCLQRGEKDTLVAGVHGAIVVKVTSNIVAKWGWTVTAAEADMHEFAYKNLDHDIVRVPQVYRFIQDDSGRGYLFMEYIPGRAEFS
jgi:hypothetical protein